MLAFNTDGPAGLINGKAPGQKPKLDAAQRRALMQIVESGPDPDRHGVVRWQLKDLTAWIYASFGDCQEFRVEAAIVDPKGVTDGTTQSTPHP